MMTQPYDTADGITYVISAASLLASTRKERVKKE
jgi:hypothetical protein